ncbi:MAG: alpha-E domain-containing protein [Gammaproteobacteria bacterium]|nr:alpha-E domain-containing protein [Gammaproteobacteria bacterium]
MLSRVAEEIYWAGRYIERAENTARLIRVNSNLVLDAPTVVSLGWEPLITITGLEGSFAEHYKNPTERNVVKFLIGDTHNPSSILSSLAFARENFRTVREIIPRTAWQSLNKLYLFAKESVQAGLTQKGRDDYLEGIISGSQQLNGLLASVMYHDEAWHFLRIGKDLERAEMTTRIIDVRSSDLLTDSDELFNHSGLSSIEWISVLKSLSAYAIYRREIDVQVRRTPILEFLFNNSRFPRAVSYCLDSVEESVGTLAHNTKPLKALRSVVRQLNTQKMENMKQDVLHQYIDELQIKLWKFHTALAKQYFLPEVALAEKAE